MINDVTTDLVDPPRFTLTGKGPADFDKDNIPEHTRKHGDLSPLRTDMPPANAFTAALDAARKEGWTVHETHPDGGVFEAVAITKWLRFRDDIVVRVRADGTGSRIDVRSKSRIGRDDFGANAKRIAHYLDAIPVT
ncbi:MAG: DUF1499 domain-containing protein [Pacificimonas sp.]